MTESSVARETNVISGTESIFWRKSSRSTFNGNCAEVAAGKILGLSTAVLIRDSKDPHPILQFDASTWAAFTGFIKRASF
jgi:hypothetical protein